MVVTDKQKGLPIMYWLPKMHKTPIGYIVAYIVALLYSSFKGMQDKTSP